MLACFQCETVLIKVVLQSLGEVTSRFEHRVALKEKEEQILRLEDALRASRHTIEHLKEQLEQARIGENTIRTEVLPLSHDQSLRLFSASLLHQFQSLQLDVNETQVLDVRAESQGGLQTVKTREASKHMHRPVPNGSDAEIGQMQETTGADTSEVLKPEGRHQVMGYADGEDRSSVEGERPIHGKSPDLSEEKQFHRHETVVAGQPLLERGQVEKRESTEKRTFQVPETRERQLLGKITELENKIDELREKLEQQALLQQSDLEMARKSEETLQDENCQLRRMARRIRDQLDQAAALYREDYQKAGKPQVGRDVTDSGMSLTPKSAIENVSGQ